MNSRVRLTKQGSAYLSNYARTVNPSPYGAEKHAILDAVRAIPGNEHFTIGKLNSWFVRHRSQSQGSRSAPALDDEVVLFPKLTQVQLQQLRTLYKKRNDPPENIITFWAGRIMADRGEVAAWIDYQHEKAKANDVDATSESSPDTLLRGLPVDPVYHSTSVSPTSEFPRPHLPTPAKSLSPTISPHTRIPSLPPIAVKQEEPRQCISPVSPSHSSIQRPSTTYMHSLDSPTVLKGLPPLLRQRACPSSLNIDHPQDAKPPVATFVPKSTLCIGGHPPPSFTDSVRQSLRLEAPSIEPPPRTPDEFDEKFEYVKNQVEAFLKKYDTGQLARLGWVPSLAQAAP